MLVRLHRLTRSSASSIASIASRSSHPAHDTPCSAQYRLTRSPAGTDIEKDLRWLGDLLITSPQ